MESEIVVYASQNQKFSEKLTLLNTNIEPAGWILSAMLVNVLQDSVSSPPVDATNMEPDLECFTENSGLLLH